MSIWDSFVSEIFEKTYVLGTILFEVCFVFLFVVCLCEMLITYFENIFVEMRIENDQFSINRKEKLGYEFHIYQKTWNINLVNPPTSFFK